MYFAVNQESLCLIFLNDNFADWFVQMNLAALRFNSISPWLGSE